MSRPAMDINNYTWLITITIVPASAVFATFMQGKKADEVKADLNKRMDEIKADLEKRIEHSESGVTGTLNRNSDELVSLGKSVAVMQSEISHLRASIESLTAELRSRPAQGQSAASGSSR